MDMIINYVLSLLDSSLICFFALTLTAKTDYPKITKIVIANLILSFLIYFFSYTEWFMPYSTILNLGAIVIVVGILTDFSISNIICLTFYYLSLGLITVLFINILNYIPSFDAMIHTDDPMFRLFYAFFTRLIVVFLLICIDIKLEPKRIILPQKLTYITVFILIFNIILLSVFFYLSLIIDLNSFNSLLIISLGFIVINLLLFFGLIHRIILIEKEKKDLQTKNELIKLSKYQMRLIQNTANEIRKYKHDQKHLYITLEYLLENKQYDEIKNIISESKRAATSFTAFTTSGNPIIDSFLNYYISNYQEIQFKINIMLEDNQDTLDDFDLCTLLGNLLSNAVEACEFVEKEKFISITIKQVHSNFIICVQNCYRADKSSEKLKSTKLDSANHGYGISSIKTIVNKYDGHFDIDFNDGMCKISLLLKL